MQATQSVFSLSDKRLPSIPLSESAALAGVSVATIRNWIKTGYLVAHADGGIEVGSFQSFTEEVAGKDKLSQRANKSLKDSHDHTALSEMVLEKLKSCSDLGALGEEYSNALSESYRNKEGIYYTPRQIVSDLFDVSKPPPPDATFCDPCCGSGNFVLRALEVGFRPENIFAYDLDSVAVALTRKRITALTGHASPNVEQREFLEFAASGQAPVFDCIATNPPWGKKTSKQQRDALAKLLGAGASNDSSSLFFFACLLCLSERGKLTLLLPDAFFNVAAYESARRKVLQYAVERLVDYGKAFRGLMTSAHGLVLTKAHAAVDASISCQSGANVQARLLNSFRANPRTIFNHRCSQQEAEVIAHLFSLPHTTLKNRAKWALGIVTGNNKKFIRDSAATDMIPVYKGADIVSMTQIKPSSAFIPKDFTLYQQVAPMNLYQAPHKLIYKFISNRLCFYYDTEQRFILNSANLLIPSPDFPVTPYVLGCLLSSTFMNWLFQKIYGSHKILRADIETLPIHAQYLRDEMFIESDYLRCLQIERTTNGTYRLKK
jgi:site-specific DNA-methyltransferase (adenine-specific)